MKAILENGSRFALDNVSQEAIALWQGFFPKHGLYDQGAKLRQIELPEQVDIMANAQANILAALVTYGQRLVAMSGIGLHVFTTATAYQLAEPGVGRYFLTAAAFAYPLIAEAVVAYYAWHASGSKINGYSIWLLAWILLLLIVVGLAAIRKRIQKN